MKKIIYILGIIGVSFNSQAIDLVVQESGPAGTYGTISSAISAANNGDRIIIHPKVGGNAFAENLTINKTLELVSVQDTTKFKVQGTIDVHASNGRIVTISGLDLVAGNIQGNGTGWKTTVNILASKLDGGIIDFSNQYYVRVISNIVENGSVNISHGEIIGNEIKNEHDIIIQNSNVGDTINIIANKVGEIYINADIFANVRNNLIEVNSGSTYVNGVEYVFSSGDLKLNIINNVMSIPESSTSSSTSGNHFVKLRSRANMRNNIFVEKNTSNSIGPSYFIQSGSVSAYNFAYLGSSSLPINTTPLASNPINADGRLILPTPCENGADPSFEFYDLDLTRGDAGCYGGSYTLDNYFPVNGSTHVFNVDMPFGLSNGSTLNIKAEGFDR